MADLSLLDLIIQTIKEHEEKLDEQIETLELQIDHIEELLKIQ